jgi:hypothetical protein
MYNGITPHYAYFSYIVERYQPNGILIAMPELGPYPGIPHHFINNYNPR